jgi:hypothetical protein
MTASPYLVPEFRGLTIVGTALTRDFAGDMTHHIVTDTTLPVAVVVVFELRP